MTRSRGPRRGQLPTKPYFILAFAWTWSLWWTSAAAGRWLPQAAEPLLFMLFMTGGLGPLVGAAWVVRRGGRAYRRRFLRRICDPRLISGSGWLALGVVAGAPAVLGAVTARVAGAPATVPDYSPAALGAVIAFALAAGVVEEPGWRGAASDAWQTAAPRVWAALGIGALWAVWHLPLYFIEGTYQHGLGFGSLRFWLTSLVLVQLGVQYVWLANGSGGSILVAILAHAGFNVAGELVPRSTTGDLVAFVVVTMTTAVVVAATKGRLRRAMDRSREQQPILLFAVERGEGHGRGSVLNV